MNTDNIKNKELLKTLMKSPSIAWLHLDAKGACVFANEVFENWHPLIKPQGKLLKDIFGDSFLGKNQGYFNEVFSGEAVLFKERLLWGNQEKNLEFYCVPIGDNKNKEVFVFIKNISIEAPFVTHLLSDITYLETAIQQKNIQLGLFNKKISQLSQIVDQTPTSIVITDKAGTIEYANLSFCEVNGYALEELIGKDMRLLKSGHHPPDFVKNFWDTLLAGKVWKGRWCNRRKDGQTYWAEAIAAPIRDEDGEIRQFIEIKEEMTSRKKIEDDLKKLSQAVEQSLTSILITDKYGVIEYVNPNFTKMTGYSLDEAIGSTPRILKSGKHDQAFYSHLWDTIISGNQWQGEVCNRKKNGELYWESQSITPLKNDNGDLAGFISVRLDDTRRKIAEEELLLHKNHLERLVEERTRKLIETHKRLEQTQSFAIIMSTHVGLDGKWLKVPQRFCDLVGYSQDELIGQSFKQMTYPDDFTYVWNQCQRLINKEIKSFDMEKRCIRKDGEIIWVYLNCSVVEDEDGAPLHFLTYIRDISAQKKTELELKKFIETSAQSEKIYALGKLAGSIAHEFNNPLYGILNILEQFEENPRLIQDEKSLLRLGIKECRRMADLIKRLQDFYRPSTDHVTRFDLGELIRDVILILKKKLMGKNIKVETRFADNLPKASFVEDQLKQVIINLVQNAEEAISHENGLIEITTALENNKIKIKVKDNGCGIPRENLKYIFDPFFSTKGVKGNGLGLSITYEIVRKHGGTIDVDSKPNEGATFTVSLLL
jgi:two-component system sensor histidine kinase/response regulator